MRDRFITTVYLIAWRAVRLLPERLAYALFDRAADWVWWRRGPGVLRLETNLARAVPASTPEQLRQLSRAGMRSYLRYWCDAFLLPGWDADRLARTVRVDDPERLKRVFAQGGVVAALAHQGNWDQAGAWACVHLAKVTTVAERLKPEAVYQEFLNYRRSLGMEILPLTGEGNLLPRLIRQVRAGAFVPLLADRDLSGNGVPVTFLGEASRMAPGPAAIALASKAPLLPVNTYYEKLPGGGHGLVLQIHEPVPVPATGSNAEKIAVMTQGCADALSEGIRQHPQDWHMLQVVFDKDAKTRDPNR